MELEKRYDPRIAKHFIEGRHMVLHCHHYNTLLHKAIVSTPFFDGPEFIFSVFRDDFFATMKTILENKRINEPEKIKKACVDFYSFSGFGKMDVTGMSEKGGKIIAISSHLASGYEKKWGIQDSPVDDFGRGFAAATWALAYGKKPTGCTVTQLKCQSRGDKSGEFKLEV